jgi:hypothetical protein
MNARSPLRFAVSLSFACLLSAGLARAEEPTSAPSGGGRAETEAEAPRGVDDPIDVIARLPPDVRAQLNGEQIEEIVRLAQRSHGAKGRWATEILVPGFFFATILGIVLVLQLSRLRRERQLHETLRAMIERGVEIPAALIVPDKEKPNDRRRGIVLATLGVGLTAFLWVVDKDGGGAWAFGLVPLTLGLGHLVAFFLDRRDPAPRDR